MVDENFDAAENAPMTCFTCSSRSVRFARWLRVVAIVACVSIVGCESGSGIDSGMNSANVAQHLSYDEDYPLVGFWKLDASDDFGLVIKKASDEHYSIWLCTPRSSTEIEWLSPTKVIEDENFKIIDENTIEVIDKGGEFKTYVRFQ